MVSFNHEDEVATIESPYMGNGTKYVKMRPPKASRSRRSGSSSKKKHAGIRLRRNKRWSW